jgi:hypothetical protein
MPTGMRLSYRLTGSFLEGTGGSVLARAEAKLRDAKVLYENSGKTADEVCKVVGVGRRIFFAYLAQQRDHQLTPTNTHYCQLG